MPENNYISKITVPVNGSDVVYLIKDAEARAAIEELVAKTTFALSVDEGTTPAGVTWIKKEGGVETPIVGTLTAFDQDTGKPRPEIYLVPATYQKSGEIDSYDEYVVINTGSEAVPAYVWERLGNTEIDFDELGDLAWHDGVAYNPGTQDSVLGVDTTFTVATLTASASGGSDDTFVKSYPGQTKKLETTSIRGVSGTVDVSLVTPTQVEATKVVLGTDEEASRITTVAKEASKVAITPATASLASAGTAFSVAQAAASAQTFADINVGSVMATAQVNNETLSFGYATVSRATILGVGGEASVTPYTFSPVTVSQVSAESVNFSAVSTITAVNVPVITSNTSVFADKVTIETKNVALANGSSTVLATGKAVETDTNGDTVMIGLGTATTATAVTDIGTISVPSHSVAVGTNDQVGVAIYNTPSVTVTDN